MKIKRKFIALMSLVLIVLISGTSIAGFIEFVPHVISNDYQDASSVFAIDLDSDGDIDVLSAYLRDNKVSWYENDGNQEFTEYTITTNIDRPLSVFAIDVDSDGDVDVLSASHDDNKVSWYENDGNQKFTQHTISSNARGAASVFAIDIDSDGDIDILSANHDDGKVAWYENDGNQEFTEYTISSNAGGAASVFAIDIDSDGDIDVLSASYNDNKIAWYENDGNQKFIEYIITTEAHRAYSVFAIDIDSDGDVDVLAGSDDDRIGQKKIIWYENDGEEIFTPRKILTSKIGRIVSIFAIDINSDSEIDIISGSYLGGSKIAWFENKGENIFTQHNIVDRKRILSIFSIDLDSDGDNDILSTNIGGDVMWYESTLHYEFCIDRTPHSQCSELKPIFCNKGVLIKSCTSCGCPENSKCQKDGSCQIPGDINKDGAVNTEDLSILLKNWGADCSENNDWCSGADTNKDKRVNSFDLSKVLNNWGKEIKMPEGITRVLSFRQGVRNYDGAYDTELDEMFPGKPYGEEESLIIDGPNNVAPLSNQVLIRFEHIFGNEPNQVKLGSHIKSATLKLYLSNTGPLDTTLHRMLQPWKEEDTWNSLEGGISADGIEAVKKADTVLSTGRSTVDVTKIVQAWSDGQPNYGLVFLPGDDTGDGWGFYSSEFPDIRKPELRIEYIHG